jgi:glycosyltransferase involved in cell wall biosynthesis
MKTQNLDPTDQRISVVIIAQDDEARISNAIKSCQVFADEVLVIDGGSKDASMQVSAQLGCKVFSNPWPGYAKQRMFGVERASYDWIFFIDTDEVVSKELALEILEKKAQLKDGKSAYSVYRIGDFLGRWLDRGEHLVRLYNRKYHAIKDCLVHEAIDVDSGQVVKMKGVLWHYGFRSIHDHIQRFNKYTDLEAQTAYIHTKPFRITALLFLPPARFLQKYILHGLFKKGVAGFAVSMFWVMYEYQVCFKHYELSHMQKQAKRVADKNAKGGETYVAQ